MSKVKVLELFSGIGGMHFALQEAKKYLKDFDYKIVRAIDISDNANQVYKHNFPEVDVRGSNICGLTPESLNKLEVDAIFMSPPCQPFTRQGHQKDTDDNRSHPFIHIVKELIPKVPRVNYILMENVKGFETSRAREILIEMLENNEFNYQEYLLCPKQLGIPNARLRYYLIATKSSSLTTKQLVSDMKNIDQEFVNYFLQKDGSCGLKSFINIDDDPFDKEKLKLTSKILKHAQVFDIVDINSNNSCCFTKSYGKYAKGTGSILQQSGNLKEVFQEISKLVNEEDKINLLKKLNLRYFSPCEVAKLLGFPVDDNFSFPTSYINRPNLCFSVLGNSLNVKIVSVLCMMVFENA